VVGFQQAIQLALGVEQRCQGNFKKALLAKAVGTGLLAGDGLAPLDNLLPRARFVVLARLAATVDVVVARPVLWLAVLAARFGIGVFHGMVWPEQHDGVGQQIQDLLQSCGIRVCVAGLRGKRVVR